jgi:hypothetical protein
MDLMRMKISNSKVHICNKCNNHNILIHKVKKVGKKAKVLILNNHKANIQIVNFKLEDGNGRIQLFKV